MNQENREFGGISEIMGAVMLIGVIAIVVGVFAVAMFSNLGGGETPAVLLKNGTGYNSVPEECLVIYHEGGDELLRSQTVIRINGIDRTAEFANYSGGLWNRLDTGESLYLPLDEIDGDVESVVVTSTMNPNNPTVIYMYGGDAGTVIHIPPVAHFSAIPLSGESPLTVQFTDQSIGNPTSWSWTFGDGGTSSAQNPSHVYTSAGTYGVSLTATNSYGSDTEYIADLIIVNPSPLSAAFSGSPLSGVVPLTVQFTDTSTGGPTSWLWNFGDGNTSTEWNPSYTYLSSGLYDVSLTVTRDSYSDGEVKTEYINVTPHPPVANFSAEPREGEWELLVNFTDLSTGNPTSWSWDFGDGETSSAQNPSHTYTEGIYTVSLTVTNEAGSDTEEKSDYVIVTGWYPEAGFKGEPKTGTAPLTVQFTDLSTQSALPIFTYSYSWDFDGDGITDSNEQNPVYTYDDPGSYTVSLTIEVYLLGFILVDTLYEEKIDYITVYPPLPVADFSGAPQSGIIPLTVSFTDLSINDPTSWSWDFGDGGSSTEQNPSHVYNSAGTYDVTLIASNAAGSSEKTVEDMIVVTLPDPPVSDFTGIPLSGNAPLTVSFTDLSTGGTPDYWSWDFGDGGTSTEQSPSHTYAIAGTYDVTLIVSNSGGSSQKTDEDMIAVTAAPPSAEFSGSPRSGSRGLTVSFTDLSTGNPTSWSWDFGDGRTSIEKNPDHRYGMGTWGWQTVTLTVTNSYGTNSITKTDYIYISFW